jgi:hypothetical protein
MYMHISDIYIHLTIMDSWEIMMMANLTNITDKQDYDIFNFFVKTILYLVKFYWLNMGKINTLIIIYLILETIIKLTAMIEEINNIKVNLGYWNSLNKFESEEEFEETEDEDDAEKKFNEDFSKSTNLDKELLKTRDEKSNKKNKKKIHKAPILDMLTDTESDDSDCNDSDTESNSDNSVNNNLAEENIIEGLPIIQDNSIFTDQKSILNCIK